MIYYTDYGKVVNTIEGENFNLAESVYLDIQEGVMRMEDWGSGCLYEGDEFFQTFCVMKYGFQPVMLEEDEYNVLKACGIYYFSKSRRKFIRDTLRAFRKREGKIR